MAAAFESVRIADFSHVIAGPYCTMILADLGADVVKRLSYSFGSDLAISS